MRIPTVDRQESGFGRTDLIAMLASLCLLIVLVLSTGNTTRTASEAVGCQNNHRKIIEAWLERAMDIPSVIGAGRWGGTLDWGIGQQITNVNTVLVELREYVRGDSTVFRCPSDRFVSPNQSARGWRFRVRTYSINAHVGSDLAGWGGRFPTYRYLSEVSEPSGIFVFAEEHPGSINDSSFATDPEGTLSPENARIVDRPASFHQRGGHFGFVDGHVELHRWQGPRVAEPVVGGASVKLLIQAANDPDALWLGRHAVRLR